MASSAANGGISRIDTADTVVALPTNTVEESVTPPTLANRSRNPAVNAYRFLLSTTKWGPNETEAEKAARQRRVVEAHRQEQQQQQHPPSPPKPSSRSRSNNSDSSSTDVEKKADLQHVETAGTAMTSFEDTSFFGSMYRDGKLVRQPAPTNDPKDPLNLAMSRKCIALFFLCFFGAMAAAAELILGAMLPVFAFVYADPPLDPAVLLPALVKAGGLPQGADPLKYLSLLEGEPPIWHIYLLASLPVLMIGVSNLFLIPLAISVGRRSVVLGCGVVAIGGCIWSGFSTSLASHLGARCVQALGAGTVESLIPFIIQDMCFHHQRNTFISAVFAAQGIIIISIGIAAPYMIVNLSWRWVYYMTAIAAGFFLIGVFFFLPETRWERTRSEMSGIPRDENSKEDYTPRTWKYDLALFHGKKEYRKGWNALVNTLKTFFYPQIFFITMLNSAMIATAFAAGYTVSPALLTKPWSWPFLHLGLCLIPVLIAAGFVGFLTGYVADWTANFVAKRKGVRIPEYQLINLVLPTICALVGSVLFGVAGQDPGSYSWALFLFALGLMAFGFLGANTVGAVYVLECYPHLAGPALVNIASFRALIAFALSFKVSEWIADFGYLKSMIIYTAIMAFFAILIPFVYYYGPAWRRRWPATHLGDFAE